MTHAAGGRPGVLISWVAAVCAVCVGWAGLVRAEVTAEAPAPPAAAPEVAPPQQQQPPPAPATAPAEPPPVAASGPLPGHSAHGESFNEGPRRAAYLMGNTGDVSFPVTTANPQAQQFFNQAIGQLHGFWYLEA